MLHSFFYGWSVVIGQNAAVVTSPLFSVVMYSRLQPGVGLYMLPEFIVVQDRDIHALIVLEESNCSVSACSIFVWSSDALLDSKFCVACKS